MSLLILRRGLSEIFNTMSRMCYELITEREPLQSVAEPFNMRVSTLGSEDEAEKDEGVLVFADLVLNTRTRDVRRGQRLIELTRTEFRLLELFLRNPRQVLTRELIFDRVWGFDFGPTSNTLSVYVGYLRRKTEAEGESRLIHTIRGIGYMLRE